MKPPITYTRMLFCCRLQIPGGDVAGLVEEADPGSQVSSWFQPFRIQFGSQASSLLQWLVPAYGTQLARSNAPESRTLAWPDSCQYFLACATELESCSKAEFMNMWYGA
jgi:hypothetical protein